MENGLCSLHFQCLSVLGLGDLTDALALFLPPLAEDAQVCCVMNINKLNNLVD